MRNWRLPLLVATVIFGATAAASAAETQIERGKYLVTISGCGTCHTPGVLLGKPNSARMLAGSEVGFGIPGLGVFVGGNLTPDKETGLGDWTAEQIIAAITKGEMPNGRKLFPVMPWPDLAHLSSDDAQAIAAYLKSLPPVKNAVRDRSGPRTFRRRLSRSSFLATPTRKCRRRSEPEGVLEARRGVARRRGQLIDAGACKGCK